MFFNLVLNLFKWNDSQRSSVYILVGSETEGNFGLGFLRKKYSCRCQTFKLCAYISLGMLGSQKVFFNLDKNLVKRNEGKSRTVLILVGSEREGIFDLGFLRKKKYSCRCQIMLLYKSRYARFTKSVFQSSQGLVQMKWGLEFWSGVASKEVLMSLSNFALKKLSVCRFTKSVFQSSHELVQMKWRQEFECMHPSRLWNRRNFWSGFSNEKVFMSLSNFAPI